MNNQGLKFLGNVADLCRELGVDDNDAVKGLQELAGSSSTVRIKQ